MTASKVIQLRKKFRVLLIGDDCVDVYRYGVVERLSPEAPVPVFKFSYDETKPGMAANHGGTSTKTRLIDLRSGQHIVRIDDDCACQPVSLNGDLNLNRYDAIVISDYNKGSVSYELIQNLRKFFEGPIFVDTKKKDLQRLDGCYIKINLAEYNALQTPTFDSKMIVTMGEEGAMFNSKIYPAPEVEVVDVTGAGDTFLAALTYKFLLTSNIDKSIEFAIKASSITVQHMGVHAPKLEEICD
jgi:D-beta-D-heptose 7-phosphate kinase/D-beta-D-heptose 1-phosphate adenosyltransferase